MKKNVETFIGCDAEYEAAKIVMFGAPFDSTTSYRPGARFGSASIRHESYGLETYSLYQDKDLEDCEIFDSGDLELCFGSSEAALSDIRDRATEILEDGKLPFMIGGEHLVTLGAVRAAVTKYPELHIIHFDAHADTYSNGSSYDHGTMFYHAPKEGLIDVNKSVQIGIRTEFNEKDGFTVIDAIKANDLSVKTISDLIHNTVDNNPCYLTFDIDCLDPAFAPGTGTPVMGGLNSDKVLKILRALKDLNIVGMDVVEVCPCYDHGEITALAAATIALEMLYIKASGQ